MIVNKDIDLKFYYRFVEFTSKLLGVDLTHERFKCIILDDVKAETETERRVKMFADSYLYAINNKNQLFTPSVIKSIYYLLTQDKMTDDLVEKIITQYYQNYEKPSHYLAVIMHIMILDLIEERGIELGFIVSSLIMLKKQRGPLVPYQFIHKSYKRAIKEQNIDKIMVIFSQIEAKEKHKANLGFVSTEIIIDIIKRLKPELMSKCKVEKLYLYGSYAKENIQASSDIDLLVVFNSNLVDLERERKRKKLKEILKTELNRTIDLLDFSHALKKLDFSEMENIIKLI